MTTRNSVSAVTWGRLATTAVGQLTDPAVAERLRHDPLSAVQEDFGLIVEPMKPHDTSDCSVAGRYYPKDRRIVVDTSVVLQRQNYTVLHELAHAVIYDVEEVADTIERSGDAQACADAEEDFADAFASALLLPNRLVAPIVGPSGPTADDVARLHEVSRTASREACAVAAVQRLPRSGYVVLADLDGTVRFAARTNTPYRLARNTSQSADSILARAGANGRASDGQATLRYPSGKFTDPHHSQAVRHGNYVFGVFTTGRPPWETGVWIPDEQPTRIQEVVCGFDECGKIWTTATRPCPKCGDHNCPRCGRCGCAILQGPDEIVCGGRCGMLVAVGRTLDGICNDCR